jgi:hypothetical protein
MNRSCDNFKDRIADSFNGGLAKGQEEKLRDHIKGCSECAAFEVALKSEDELLGRLFAGFEADLERQQGDVIGALFCVETSRRDKVIARINSLIDHPAFKLAAAAAVILFVTFYSIKTMNWLYDLKNFMDVCSVTIK